MKYLKPKRAAAQDRLRAHRRSLPVSGQCASGGSFYDSPGSFTNRRASLPDPARKSCFPVRETSEVKPSLEQEASQFFKKVLAMGTSSHATYQSKRVASERDERKDADSRRR